MFIGRKCSAFFIKQAYKKELVLISLYSSKKSEKMFFDEP